MKSGAATSLAATVDLADHGSCDQFSAHDGGRRGQAPTRLAGRPDRGRQDGSRNRPGPRRSACWPAPRDGRLASSQGRYWCEVRLDGLGINPSGSLSSRTTAVRSGGFLARQPGSQTESGHVDGRAGPGNAGCEAAMAAAGLA